MVGNRGSGRTTALWYYAKKAKRPLVRTRFPELLFERPNGHPFRNSDRGVVFDFLGLDDVLDGAKYFREFSVLLSDLKYITATCPTRDEEFVLEMIKKAKWPDPKVTHVPSFMNPHRP